MADVLGIFGKYDVYLGTYWQLDSPSNYISAAYKIYRNYDGNNSTVGDYLIPSVTSDSVSTSVYGFLSETRSEIHLITINKKLNETVNSNFSISSQLNIQSGRVWKLDGNSSEISEINPVANITNNIFSYTLPAGSVCHFVLQTNAVDVEENNLAPKNYFLTAYPNPFNPLCKMEYNVPINSNSHLDIFSATGELVKSYSGLSGSGYLSWDGSNESGQKISSGVYFAILISNSGIISTQKLILQK